MRTRKTIETKDELLARLKEVKDYDHEAAHAEADLALLEYIDDEDITEAFEEVKTWYA